MILLKGVNTCSDIPYPCGWLCATGGQWPWFARVTITWIQVTRHIATSNIDLTTCLHLSHRITRWKAIPKLVVRAGRWVFLFICYINLRLMSAWQPILTTTSWHMLRCTLYGIRFEFRLRTRCSLIVNLGYFITSFKSRQFLFDLCKTAPNELIYSVNVTTSCHTIEWHRNILQNHTKVWVLSLPEMIKTESDVSSERSSWTS